MTEFPKDWRDRVGHVAQVARIDHFVRDDGPARGNRVLRVVSGGGLEFEVLPDRGFDIGQASFLGMPLAWMGPAGWQSGISPNIGTEWLRGFGGGLLTTCGMDSFGPPSADGGREHGLHGPISAQRAEVTQTVCNENGLTLSGTLRQAGLFAENLRLDRTISVPLCGTHLDLCDTVTNDGVEGEGHMILWHCNFGWPLLDDGAVVEGPQGEPAPRDPNAEVGIGTWAQVHGPLEDYPEQVFIHSAPKSAKARLVNPSRNIAVTLEWDGVAMPAMFQWKMLQYRHYVMGLEPANTAAIHGRAAARAAGALPILAPGQSQTYRLRLSVGAAA